MARIPALLRTLLCKVLADLRRDLAVRHPVDRLKNCDPAAQVLSLKTSLQFALCFAGTENQNGLRSTDGCNDSIVVGVEMSRKGSLLAVIRHHQLSFKATLER